jgi:hypothetical protein
VLMIAGTEARRERVITSASILDELRSSLIVLLTTMTLTRQRTNRRETHGAQLRGSVPIGGLDSAAKNVRARERKEKIIVSVSTRPKRSFA